jgi:putative ABC transport system permease protein
MEELRRKSDLHESIAYVATLSNQVIKYSNSAVENCIVLCVSHEYYQIKSFELREGRYFSDHESASGPPIALIGADIADALFVNQNPIGNDISIRGTKFNIIGVMEKEGSSLVGNSSDNQVLIPLNFARNVVNLRSDAMDPYFMVKAKEGISLTELKDDLKGSMRSVRKIKPREDDDFALNETSLLSKGMKQVFSTLNIAGWIIGGFSILVGGFGIANIMFVSVKERTGIIGIQKSLGSKNYFILLQFLVESVVLCIIGGLFGLALVYLLAQAVSMTMDFKFVLTFNNLLMGLLISATVGIISGYIPAHQASRMNPVDAIRSV